MWLKLLVTEPAGVEDNMVPQVPLSSDVPSTDQSQPSRLFSGSLTVASKVWLAPAVNDTVEDADGVALEITGGLFVGPGWVSPAIPGPS